MTYGKQPTPSIGTGAQAIWIRQLLGTQRPCRGYRFEPDQDVEWITVQLPLPAAEKARVRADRMACEARTNGCSSSADPSSRRPRSALRSTAAFIPARCVRRATEPCGSIRATSVCPQERRIWAMEGSLACMPFRERSRFPRTKIQALCRHDKDLGSRALLVRAQGDWLLPSLGNRDFMRRARAL